MNIVPENEQVRVSKRRKMQKRDLHPAYDGGDIQVTKVSTLNTVLCVYVWTWNQ